MRAASCLAELEGEHLCKAGLPMLLREDEWSAENCLDFRLTVGYGTPPKMGKEY